MTQATADRVRLLCEWVKLGCPGTVPALFRLLK